jgi:hypothetical protein
LEQGLGEGKKRTPKKDKLFSWQATSEQMNAQEVRTMVLYAVRGEGTKGSFAAKEENEQTSAQR